MVLPNMSSRKRPLSELQNAQTPIRYVPSTPHAIRALQQRSGAKTRSVRKTRAFGETVRPDSARGILRKFAKLTAPVTKKTIPTPATGRGKENQAPDGHNLQGPHLTLNIDDSLEDLNPPGYDEEEDSELPVPPTPSILPDQDDAQSEDRRNDPTITFKSIDFAQDAQRTSEKIDRRRSRSFFPASDPLADNEGYEDPTILSEMGRRAISEEPTGRLSRYSFGSIRMSDFGSELEIRRESDQQEQTKTLKLSNEYSRLEFEYAPLDFGGETERLENLQPSPSLLPPDESTMNIPPLDESFQLEMRDEESISNHAKVDQSGDVGVENGLAEDPEILQDDSLLEPALCSDKSTEQIVLNDEGPKTLSKRRRKKQKMTRHGELVPSLPSSLIKRVAIEAQARLGNRRPKLGRDHMKALEQATEWFFEQAGEDLEAYSDHARRKKRIDHSDVLMLMRRQRVLQSDGELEKAVRELLPKEAVAELDGMV